MTIYLVEEDNDSGVAATYIRPGLLLSLGDGSAVQVTAEMLRTAMFPPPNSSIAAVQEHLLREAGRVIAALIQQAQEARDAE